MLYLNEGQKGNLTMGEKCIEMNDMWILFSFIKKGDLFI